MSSGQHDTKAGRGIAELVCRICGDTDYGPWELIDLRGEVQGRDGMLSGRVMACEDCAKVLRRTGNLINASPRSDPVNPK